MRRVQFLETAAGKNRDSFITELKTLKYNTEQFMDGLLMDEATKSREKAQLNR